jgi:hypothetical protein
VCAAPRLLTQCFEQVCGSLILEGTKLVVRGNFILKCGTGLKQKSSLDLRNGSRMVGVLLLFYVCFCSCFLCRPFSVSCNRLHGQINHGNVTVDMNDCESDDEIKVSAQPPSTVVRTTALARSMSPLAFNLLNCSEYCKLTTESSAGESRHVPNQR